MAAGPEVSKGKRGVRKEGGKEGRPFSDRASEGCVDCPDQCEEATLDSPGAAQSDMTRALSETSGNACVGLRACVTVMPGEPVVGQHEDIQLLSTTHLLL